MRGVAGIGTALLAAVAIVGCSGNGGSPASPSAIPAGGSATINGTAQALGGSSASTGTLLGSRSVAALAGGLDGLRVCAVEADVCVMVDDSTGAFVLSGAFSNDVELHFEGPGQNVRVTVLDVRAGETVTVRVELNGNRGALQVESRHGGGPTVSLCHVTGNGRYHLIEVAASAEPAHIAHGDGYPGEKVPGEAPLVFDDECGIPRPDVEIEKDTNGEDADAAPGPTVLAGDDVEWTYVVTNTGDYPLVNVVVEDDQIGTVPCPKDSLSPRESMTCRVSGIAVVGAYGNLGTVEADVDSALGLGPVSDSDPSHYVGVGAIEEPTEPGAKVVLCHVTGNGSYHRIEVGAAAEPAHLKHGDGYPLGPVPSDPSKRFTANCSVS
jgi:hypothetical protein